MEKKTYNWLTVALLSMVTCGIYSWIVWNEMTQKNNELAAKYGVAQIPSFWQGLLLGVVTCGIYQIYWMYKFQEQQVAISKASGVNVAPSDSPIVLLLCGFVPFYSFYVLCDNYNRTVEVN